MLSAKPWRIEAVCFFIAAQVFCVIFGGAAAFLFHKAGMPGFKGEEDFGNILLGTLSFQGATCVLMLVFFRLNEVDWRDVLGFGRKKLWLSLLLAFGAVVFILPVAFLLQAMSLTIMAKLHWTPQNEEAVTLLTNASSRATQIYLAFFAVVLAPIAEEFIFRGVLYPFIKQRGFPGVAWIGVSLLFALIHADAGIFLPLFVLALVLTWLYETTDCLIVPMFAHALFNAANLIILTYISQ